MDAEMRDMRDQILGELRDGFGRMDARQDKFADQLLQHVQTLSDHGAQLKTLNHEVFARPRRRAPDADPAESGSWRGEMKTAAKIGAAIGGGVVVLIEALSRLAPAVIGALFQ